MTTTPETTTTTTAPATTTKKTANVQVRCPCCGRTAHRPAFDAAGTYPLEVIEAIGLGRGKGFSHSYKSIANSAKGLAYLKASLKRALTQVREALAVLEGGSDNPEIVTVKAPKIVVAAAPVERDDEIIGDSIPKMKRARAVEYLARRTVKNLRAFASDNGVTLRAYETKPALVTKIVEHFYGRDEATPVEAPVFASEPTFAPEPEAAEPVVENDTPAENYPAEPVPTVKPATPKKAKKSLAEVREKFSTKTPA